MLGILGYSGKRIEALMPFHLQGDQWSSLVAACQLCLSSGHLQLEPCQLLLQSSPLLLPGCLCHTVIVVQPCHVVPPVGQVGLLGKALLLQVPAWGKPALTCGGPGPILETYACSLMCTQCAVWQLN